MGSDGGIDQSVMKQLEGVNSLRTSYRGELFMNSSPSTVPGTW